MVKELQWINESLMGMQLKCEHNWGEIKPDSTTIEVLKYKTITTAETKMVGGKTLSIPTTYQVPDRTGKFVRIRCFSRECLSCGDKQYSYRAGKNFESEIIR